MRPISTSRLFYRFAKSVILLIVPLSILLAACGQGSVSDAASPSGDQSKGTLNGNVVLSPICPVERIDGSCPPRAATFRQVRIMSAGRVVVATTTTDKQGHFSVVLAPGDYNVLVNNVSPGVRNPSQGVPVHVEAGQVRSVKIVLDTGIR